MSSAPADPCEPNVDKAGIKNGWMDGWIFMTFYSALWILHLQQCILEIRGRSVATSSGQSK